MEKWAIILPDDHEVQFMAPSALTTQKLPVSFLQPCRGWHGLPLWRANGGCGGHALHSHCMEAGAFKMLQQAQPIEHEALGCRSCGSDGLKRLLVIVGVDPCLM